MYVQVCYVLIRGKEYIIVCYKYSYSSALAAKWKKNQEAGACIGLIKILC